MSNFYCFTDLIGGGAGALDSRDGADLSDGDAALVVIEGTTYTYRLDASSGASEDSPNIIAPDSNPGTKRWILQSAVGAQGGSGDHFATREYVDVALGAFKSFFISNTASGVGALNYAYPRETGEGQSSIVTSALGSGPTQLVKGFITEVGEPNTTTIHSGVIEIHFHAKKGDSNERITELYAVLSSVDANGTSNKTPIATSEVTAELTDTETDYHLHVAISDDVEIADTARLILDVYANVGAGAQDAVVTLYMEGTEDSYFTAQVDSGIWQDHSDKLDDLSTTDATAAELDELTDGSESTLHSHAGGAADDTPYNATSWDGNADAATKNAIRDKVVTIDSAIGSNTTHRGSNGSDHSIVGNNTTAIGLNTTHRSSDGSNHSKVGANETAIGLNTTHRSSDGSNHSKVGANETAIGLNTTHRGVSSGNPHSVTPTELSLVIGTNVQAHSAKLVNLATTGATAAELDTLTDGGETALHSHAGEGAVVKIVNTQTQTKLYNASTPLIAYDNSKPQSNEGLEVMTVAITPDNASNKLKIDVIVNWGGGGGNKVLALFQDAGADAIATSYNAQGSDQVKTDPLTFTMVAGTTSSITFKVRVGGTGGIVTVNGVQNDVSKYGGTLVSSITVTEFLPPD